MQTVSFRRTASQDFALICCRVFQVSYVGNAHRKICWKELLKRLGYPHSAAVWEYYSALWAITIFKVSDVLDSAVVEYVLYLKHDIDGFLTINIEGSIRRLLGISKNIVLRSFIYKQLYSSMFNYNDDVKGNIWNEDSNLLFDFWRFMKPSFTGTDFFILKYLLMKTNETPGCNDSNVLGKLTYLLDFHARQMADEPFLEKNPF